MEWLNENLPYLAVLAPVLLAGGWKFATGYAAKAAAESFSKAIDFLLDKGDEDWDYITRLAVKKLEEEIPDELTAEHPKIQALAKEICAGEGFFHPLRGQEKPVARLIAAVAQAIDKRAKRGYGKEEEKPESPPEA